MGFRAMSPLTWWRAVIRFSRPRRLVAIQLPPGPSEHAPKHPAGEEARLGVPLARVVRREERDRREIPGTAMAEPRPGDGQRVPGRPPRAQERVHGDPTQDDDHAKLVFEDLYLPLEIPLAVRELLAGRSVAGRRAPHGSGDAAVPQDQPIVPRHGGRAIREARVVQGAIQPVPAAVPGEHPPGAVPTMGRGGEPHDQEAGERVSEAGQRPAPVLEVPERGALFTGDTLAVRDEPRALPTRDDPRV